MTSLQYQFRVAYRGYHPGALAFLSYDLFVSPDGSQPRSSVVRVFHFRPFRTPGPAQAVNGLTVIQFPSTRINQHRDWSQESGLFCSRNTSRLAGWFSGSNMDSGSVCSRLPVLNWVGIKLNLYCVGVAFIKMTSGVTWNIRIYKYIVTCQAHPALVKRVQ